MVHFQGPWWVVPGRGSIDSYWIEQEWTDNVLEGVVVFSTIHVFTEASQQIFMDTFFEYVIKINK